MNRCLNVGKLVCCLFRCSFVEPAICNVRMYHQLLHLLLFFALLRPDFQRRRFARLFPSSFVLFSCCSARLCLHLLSQRVELYTCFIRHYIMSVIYVLCTEIVHFCSLAFCVCSSDFPFLVLHSITYDLNAEMTISYRIIIISTNLIELLLYLNDPRNVYDEIIGEKTKSNNYDKGNKWKTELFD